MGKVQKSLCLIAVAILLNIQFCESLNSAYYYGNISCAFFGTKTYEESFNSLSNIRRRTSNNINVQLNRNADGSNVLTVVKSPQDKKEVPVNGVVDFAFVEVHSSAARVRFANKNSDFELNSELGGGDAISYDVSVKLFQC